ncbi:MAG TPA: hypothetical protein VIQ22_00805 [Gammaproteobacteria bacterium]
MTEPLRRGTIPACQKDCNSIDALGSDLYTVAQALTHQRFELQDAEMDAGLRCTVIALIDRNHELLDQLLSAIEHPQVTV